MNRDVPNFALMAGVPARQIGWMSSHGERLNLPLSGDAQIKCENSGSVYVLRDNICQLK